MRRRRLDDYRGSYQAWGLSAFVLASLSLFAFLPLAPLVGWSLAQIPRLPTLENHVHFTTWFVGIVAGSLLTRWLIETRRCRLAQSCLVAAGVLALLSNLQIVPLLKLSSYQLGELVTGALYFTSLLLGLAGLFVYGRHVRLDAQGLIAHHKKKVVKKKRTLKRIESEAAADEEQSTGEESEAAELPTPKAAISRSTVQQEEADDEEEEPEEGSRLSKAERRKLRRDQRKAS